MVKSWTTNGQQEDARPIPAQSQRKGCLCSFAWSRCWSQWALVEMACCKNRMLLQHVFFHSLQRSNDSLQFLMKKGGNDSLLDCGSEVSVSLGTEPKIPHPGQGCHVSQFPWTSRKFDLIGPARQFQPVQANPMNVMDSQRPAFARCRLIVGTGA